MDTKTLNIRLTDAPLRTCLTQAEMEKLKWLTGQRASLKRIFLSKGKALIRLYVGQPFYVGAIRNYKDNAEKVLRYSDMAHLYFRRYRLRGIRIEPKNSEFNFSFDRAQKDLEFETALKEILRDLEKELLRAQVLPSLDELAARRTALVAKQSASLTRSAKLAEIDRKIDLLVQGITILVERAKQENKL